MRRDGSRFPRLFDLDFWGDGHSGAQGKVAVVLLHVGEIDADGDALDDLDVVAGGVFGREEREFGAGGSADLGDLAVELAAAESVDLEGDFLAGTHPRDLGLLR